MEANDPSPALRTPRDTADRLDDWELLLVPPLVEHAKKSPSPPQGEGNSIVPKEQDDLCGYLMKLGERGIIKTWKRRWFIYDHRRCFLHYYHRPQDVEALGYINIANASFNVRADDKCTFEISSEGRTYQLQAPDRNTMLFWLQELRTRRREFGLRSEDKNKGLIRTASTANDADDMVKEKVRVDTIERRIKKPETIGEGSSHLPLENRNSWNFSFTNLNTEFKNWRKNTFNPVTGEPLNGDKINIPKVDFGFSQMVCSINEQDGADGSKEPALLIDISPDGMGNQLNGRCNGASSKNAQDHSSSLTCHRCEEKDAMINVLKEAISIAQVEIQTRDEVIKSFSEQLQLVANSKVRKSPEEELLEEREQYIFQLTRMIKKFQNEIDELKGKLAKDELRIEEFCQKEDVLKEMINAKDDTIMELTSRIENLDNSVEVATEDPEVEVKCNITVNADELSYTELRETCNAVKEQNDFLNKEILEMTAISQSNVDKLKATTQKLERQEAEFLKLKSRYLFILNEYTAPKRDNASSKSATISSDIIERLIDDAIDEQEDLAERVQHSADKYGFYDSFDEDTSPKVSGEDVVMFPENDDEQMPLEVSTKVKWENYLVSLGRVPITRTEELKVLVRQGIPHQYRAQVWKDLLFQRIENERNRVGPTYYMDLLAEKEGMYSPSMKQIELDLLRTLPNNKYYEKTNSEGTSKLRRVLLAYSWHNPPIGYCQGLNRLGAILLLYLDEETAFWGLVAMVEYLMPVDYFSKTLIGAQIDQRVLKELLEMKWPQLSAHLLNMNLDLSLISFNWFLTVFVDFFPIELCLRVWDTFFSEGSKVLFRYALSIFGLFKEDLMKFSDAGPVFDFFRNVPKARFDTAKVMNIAFVQLNPFSMRMIESKRRYYRPVLQAQLDEFEVMRQSYRQKRENNEVILSDDEG